MCLFTVCVDGHTVVKVKVSQHIVHDLTSNEQIHWKVHNMQSVSVNVIVVSFYAVFVDQHQRIE